MTAHKPPSELAVKFESLVAEYEILIENLNGQLDAHRALEAEIMAVIENAQYCDNDWRAAGFDRIREIMKAAK